MRLEPPRWWYAGRLPLAAWGLLPISAAYGLLVRRRFRTAAPYESKLPVLCVGNFTIGGAGKTPVALTLASMLKDAGRNPAFLTRGYGGYERGPHRARPAVDAAARVGDEPLLLAREAATVVSRDRPAGARLIEKLPADVIVMDDGFQNPSLRKDFNLIVIDAGAGTGSGRVFPLGPLRAPLGFQAGMADAILIVGTDGDGAGKRVTGKVNLALQEARSRSRTRGERYFSQGVNVFQARIAPRVTEEMRSRPFVAFCGIGRPAKFFDTLEAAGIAVVKTHSFPDHHIYTEREAVALLAEANAMHAGLITTEKDLVRLTGAAGTLAELRRASIALPIWIEFSGEDGELLLKAILAHLPS